MFLVGLIFAAVALMTFAIIVLLTRPTTVERAIEERIAKLHGSAGMNLAANDEGSQLVKLTRLSRIDWLDGFLQSCDYAHRLQLLIEQAESTWSVGKVMGIAASLAVVGYAIGCYVLPGATLALLPAIVLAISPLLVLRFRKQRRLREFNRQLPEAIDLMSRALRAGHSLAAAIEIVGEECPEPVRTEFREVYRQQNFGLPARDALVQLARRMPMPELGFVVTAMLLQRETGGNLVEVLDRTAGVIRERLRIQGEIRIYTAQGRLTGWILTILPIAMFFLLGMANRGYTRVLIEDPTGRKLVYTGLVLMVVGGLAIRKIVDVKI
jgi:tight adherence protein B